MPIINFNNCCRYDAVGESVLTTLEEDDEEEGFMLPNERRLELEDILPIDPKKYDKNRAPHSLNQPTLVDFHVTVLSLDSINEESMVFIDSLAILS